jgi:type IV pilus assembly protein PilM
MLVKNMQIFNPFSGMGNRELIGIDLSTNNLKIAHVKIYPNKRELVEVLNRNLGGLSDDDIAKTIQDSIKELKIKKPIVAITIPAHLVITKNIEVPSVNDKEIREIINLQAGRHTPYSREEIIIDYIAIGTYKQNYTKILLLIVTNSVIKKQFLVLDKAGVEIERVLLAQEGIAYLTTKIFKLDSLPSPVSIINIDEGFTDFTIVFRAKPIFIRSIPIGRQHLMAEAEKFQTKFAVEIKKSMEAYQAENIEKNPNMLILTGALEELGSLESVLNEAMHLPVRLMPYLTNILSTDKAVSVVQSTKNLSFFGVIAPLWAFPEAKVNLIPEEIKLKMALQRRSKDLIKSGILFLVILVLIFLTLISNIYFKSAYLKNLNAQYQSLTKDAKKLDEDSQKNSLIRSYLANRGISLKVLTELHEIAPLYLELNDIRFDKEGKFTIRGTAESMSTVFSFVDALEKSKYFKEVKTKYTTRRQEGKKDVTDFEINSLLKKVADL